MQEPIPPERVEPTRVVTRGFAYNYAVHPNFPDEMMQPDGSIRPYWREFVSMLDDLSPLELRQRREHARRLIHENGVTHNVYGDPNGLDRPWSLDFIPLLIPANSVGRHQRRLNSTRAPAGPVAGRSLRTSGHHLQTHSSS
jgi:hypothetical protein